MENENNINKLDNDFSFLQDETVQNHFADLNIELLRGGHIQDDNYYLFSILSDYTDSIYDYYRTIYGLELVKENKDSTSFYYLDFLEDLKGKLSASSRHKELSESQTIVGIMLLNMYYDRYFEQPKNITFNDIKKQIKSGEYSALYKKLLFKVERENYSDTEWARVVKMLSSVVRDFEKMGWIKRYKDENPSQLSFTIRESIYRFQKMYENEILNFGDFVEDYNKSKSQ